jgi:hypothetical protein
LKIVVFAAGEYLVLLLVVYLASWFVEKPLVRGFRQLDGEPLSSSYAVDNVGNFLPATQSNRIGADAS